MAVVNWDENLPSGTSAIKQGDDDIRSAFTAIRTGLASEHSWPTGPGAEDRGLHTPNSSRVSFGASSKAPLNANLTSGTSGVMFLSTDDPGLMFAYPSTASVPVGGSRTVHADVAYSANNHFVLSAFTGTSGSSLSYGDNSITFAAIPTVVVAGVSPDGTTGIHASIENIAAHEIVILTFTGAGVASSGDTVHIMAFGLADFSEGPAAS